MRIDDDGVRVEDLIEAIKQAIKTASVSSTDAERDLRVGSVQLTLHVLAVRTTGGGVEFRIPFIGMPVKLGGKVTRQDTHEIDISLVPPDLTGRMEVRDADVESVLVDAIETIRAAVASAGTGDDPFILADSSVTMSFGITADGAISLGIDAALSSELTHTLTLSLIPAGT